MDLSQGRNTLLKGAKYAQIDRNESFHMISFDQDLQEVVSRVSGSNGSISIGHP